MAESQPPGWYPVPGSPDVQRWWDGSRWTGEVRAAGGGDTGDLSARYAEGATVTALPSVGPSSGSSPTSTSIPGWQVSWPGSWPMATQPPAKKGRRAKQVPTVPSPPPLPAAPEAAWRVPAVEAWKERTEPGRPAKRTRRRGKAKRG